MLQIFSRTIFLYLILIGIMRFLGKRQLGQLEPSEVAVTMLLADLASIPMQEENIPIWAGLVPMLAVLAMEYSLSFLTVRSIKIRKLLCGKPVILIENGKFLQQNMRKTRVTLDELTSKLREKDVLDIQSVQYAILETGGNLSVFLYAKERPLTAKDAEVSASDEYLPVTIISDGRLLSDNLKKTGKDEKWLQKVLKEEKLTMRETFLLTVDCQNRVCCFKKEKPGR